MTPIDSLQETISRLHTNFKLVGSSMTFLAIQGSEHLRGTHLVRKPAPNQVWTHHSFPSIIQKGLFEGGRIDSYIPKIFSNPRVRNTLLIFIELLVQLQNKGRATLSQRFLSLQSGGDNGKADCETYTYQVLMDGRYEL